MILCCEFSMPRGKLWVTLPSMETKKQVAGFEHVLITGGTGFIGTALTRRLLRMGSRVSVLTRNSAHAQDHFGGQVTTFVSMEDITPEDAPVVIVNLAGKNLGEQRWNTRVKDELVNSRVNVTQRVVDYIASADTKPQLLISGSAVGYYGARVDEELKEDAGPGNEFQSDLCRRWEEAALQAEQYGVRVCISRTGVVMGRGGGALSGLVPLFRLGLGAMAGSGRQWFSWVHLVDLVNMFIGFMQDTSLAGPFNNTSPHPVTNREFSQALGRALQRPVWLRSPGWAMHLLYGEMAHLFLTGQRVIPARHLQAGFDYCYPYIDAALEEALQDTLRKASIPRRHKTMQ
jgi:uncharacterized protein (TIGR01777 family)